MMTNLRLVPFTIANIIYKRDNKICLTHPQSIPTLIGVSLCSYKIAYLNIKKKKQVLPSSVIPMKLFPS
jgi:hypothetical protein